MLHQPAPTGDPRQPTGDPPQPTGAPRPNGVPAEPIRLPDGRGEVVIDHPPFEIRFKQSFDDDTAVKPGTTSAVKADIVEDFTVALADRLGQQVGTLAFGPMPGDISHGMLEILMRSPGLPADLILEVLSLGNHHRIPHYSDLGSGREEIASTYEHRYFVPGTTPSTVVEPPKIRILEIGPEGKPKEIPGTELAPPPAGSVRWINIENPDQALLAELQNKFKFNRHALAGCLEFDDRPRVEDYRDHLLVVMHSLHKRVDDPLNPLVQEIDTFLAPGLLVTIRTEPIAQIDRAWARALETVPRTEERKAEYILYRLADRFLEVNETVIDEVHRQVERVAAADMTLSVIQNELPEMSKTLAALRRLTVPLANMFQRLSKRADSFIDKETATLFGNLPDHANHLAQDIDDARHEIESVRSTALVTTANTFSKVALKIAMVQAVVTPIMVISSFFGQNFEGLPFKSEYLMWGSIAASFLSSLGLWAYFRFKKFP